MSRHKGNEFKPKYVLIGRTLAAGNVVEESGCLYISSVAADGNPISREQHREMGLPSADALKM